MLYLFLLFYFALFLLFLLHTVMIVDSYCVNAFQCNSVCIDVKLVCDGYSSCSDGSDEDNCGSGKVNGSHCRYSIIQNDRTFDSVGQTGNYSFPHDTLFIHRSSAAIFGFINFILLNMSNPLLLLGRSYNVN